MRRSMNSIWWPDSNQTASGKPGAVHTDIDPMDGGTGRPRAINPPSDWSTSTLAARIPPGLAPSFDLVRHANQPPDIIHITSPITGARDEFHMAATVQNLKRLAQKSTIPPPLPSTA